MKAPRVAIVGPRRVRTGLGPFLAKHLVAHGASVPAFVASKPETIADGRAALRDVGIDAEGFVELDALLAKHPIDAVVIASPHQTHLAWLEAAVARKLHVFCEKPLVWSGPSPSWEAGRMIDQAAEAGIVLFENCPWPHALAAFDALHPDARKDGVTTFEMELAPSSTSPRDMLVDAMSHAISVLQEFAAPDDAVVDWPKWGDWGTGLVESAFKFGREGRTIDVLVRLRHVAEQPRPMAIVVNGKRAERRVRMEDYSFRLVDGSPDGDREVPLPDPMGALVGEFVRTIRDGEPVEARGARLHCLRRRMEVLEEIVGSFPGA